MTTTTTLATHSLLLALPAFVPAVLLVGVIVFIAVRDRRRGDDDEDGDPDSPAHTERADLTPADTAPADTDTPGTDPAERR